VTNEQARFVEKEATKEHSPGLQPNHGFGDTLEVAHDVTAVWIMRNL